MNYLNERKRFTPEQITGIMFTKLKQIINTELATTAVDCVIGVKLFFLFTNHFIKTEFFLFIKVPCFFTDAERRAMLDAAQIAGWNCIRLLNETTAGK